MPINQDQQKSNAVNYNLALKAINKEIEKGATPQEKSEIKEKILQELNSIILKESKSVRGIKNPPFSLILLRQEFEEDHKAERIEFNDDPLTLIEPMLKKVRSDRAKLVKTKIKAPVRTDQSKPKVSPPAGPKSPPTTPVSSASTQKLQPGSKSSASIPVFTPADAAKALDSLTPEHPTPRKSVIPVNLRKPLSPPTPKVITYPASTPVGISSEEEVVQTVRKPDSFVSSSPVFPSHPEHLNKKSNGAPEPALLPETLLAPLSASVSPLPISVKRDEPEVVSSVPSVALGK